jgi:hypothetical protein
VVKKALIAAMLFACSSGASAAMLLIDNFDFKQRIAQDKSNGLASSSATKSGVNASIIGGEREIYVNAVTGADAFGSTRAGVASSRFSFSNDSGVAGFGALRWDGTSHTGFDPALADFGIDRTGFAGVNFSAIADSLKITFLNSDSAFPFTLQFFSSDTDWTTFTFAAIPVCAPADASCLSQAGAVVGPVDFFFNFALMNLLGTKFGAGVNFSNVTAMQAIFNFNVGAGTPGLAQSIDFSIDFVDGDLPAIVPEPGSLALNALGLFGLWFVSRRRRTPAGSGREIPAHGAR